MNNEATVPVTRHTNCVSSCPFQNVDTTKNINTKLQSFISYTGLV